MDIKLTKAAWPCDVSPSSQAWFTDKLNEALDEIVDLQALNKQLLVVCKEYVRAINELTAITGKKPTNNQIYQMAKALIEVADKIKGGKEKCEWIYDDDYDVWETKCDNAFCLAEGTPKDNKMKFCPYCGKRIKQVLRKSK